MGLNICTGKVKLTSANVPNLNIYINSFLYNKVDT